LVIYRESTREEIEVVVKRGIISLPSVDVEMLDNSIALLKIYNFYEPLINDFEKIIPQLMKNNVKGVVVDLRSNPGGYLDTYVIIGNHFFNKGKKLLIEDFNNDRPSKVYKTEINGELRNIPMTVLVNEGTASAAEILAGSLRDNRGVKIIGQTSFGKGSVQELIPLSGSNQLKLTIAKWLTPKGYSISEDGIIPDYEVELPENYYQGKSSFEIGNLKDDIQLKKAYDVLKNQIK
jgi:carboxyl-terminal processing protease